MTIIRLLTSENMSLYISHCSPYSYRLLVDGLLQSVGMWLWQTWLHLQSLGATLVINKCDFLVLARGELNVMGLKFAHECIYAFT